MPKHKDIVRIPLDDEDNRYSICLVYSKDMFRDKKSRELLRFYSDFIKSHFGEIAHRHESDEDEFSAHWSISGNTSL